MNTWYLRRYLGSHFTRDPNFRMGNFGPRYITAAFLHTRNTVLWKENRKEIFRRWLRRVSLGRRWVSVELRLAFCTIVDIQIGRCNSTSHITRPELPSFKGIRNKNHFSPDARVVRFCRLGDRQPVIRDIANLWLNTSPFQWRFNMLLCISKENISHSFAVAQKLRHFIDVWCVRRVVANKMIGGDLEQHVFQQERKQKR